MNSQKIYNVLVSGDSGKAEMKQALEGAALAMETELSAQETTQLSQALQSCFASEFDAVRQRSLDLFLLHVQKFAAVQLPQTFYAVFKCLATGNLRYDAAVRSETSRNTLLTILLKLIIQLEKMEKEKLIQPLELQQQPITAILESQLADPCPENRIQCCKCVFRFARTFKYLLSEQQIYDLSEAIVKNFNHQRAQIRQLMLQAFVQLHLCVQSKEINKYWNPILNFLLNDEKSLEPMIEAAQTLITQHIDRHVFADMFALPFIANLQEPTVLAKFVEVGEFYANENRKYDKLVQLQREMEQCNTEAAADAKKYDQFIAQFNQKYFRGSTWDKQLCAGCRILGQICLQKNQKTILADMKQVNSAQTRKLSQLMCNLMLLCQNYCLSFSADLVQNLGLMIHDSFHAQEYEKVVHLIGKFVSVADIVNLVKSQVTGNAQSTLGLVRIYDFALKYFSYAEMSEFETSQFLELLLTEDANCVEDSNFVQIQTALILTLVRFGDFSATTTNLIAVAAASCVERVEPMISKSTKPFEEKFAELGLEFDFLKIVAEIKQFLQKREQKLSLEDVMKQIGLERDFSASRNLLLKIQIFSRFLNLTNAGGFHQKHITQLIRMGLKLLKAAQNHEKVDRNTRYQALLCNKLIIQELNLDDQQLLFFADQLFLSSTWKHGVRSPECLQAAMECISVVLAKCSALAPEDAVLNTVLQKICVNLESDYLQIRLASLQLCRSFFAHIFKFAQGEVAYKFEDLAWNLIQRLDDAKSGVSVQALELFDELASHTQKIETNKTNICLLMVTHLNDEIVEIREKCAALLEKHLRVLDPEEVAEQMKGKVFEWIDAKKILGAL